MSSTDRTPVPICRSNRTWTGAPLTPGVNVDKVDYESGMKMLDQVWPDSPVETKQVILYALQRWARGEEPQAERAAIDRSFHGIDFTSWRMILAAACSQS